jgi:hypothetical protein
MSALTETEARTKWCPFVRFVLDSQGFAAGNRFDGARHSLCIASECMAWRFLGAAPTTQMTAEGKPIESRGFCGLAGRPS